MNYLPYIMAAYAAISFATGLYWGFRAAKGLFGRWMPVRAKDGRFIGRVASFEKTDRPQSGK